MVKGEILEMERESVTFEPEWLEDKRLNWPARILLAKLVRLTNNGKSEFKSNNCNGFFMDMMNFTLSEVKNSWSRLVAAGYITKHTNKIANNETVIALKKGVAQFTPPVAEKTLPGGLKDATGWQKRCYGVAQFTPSSNHSNNHSNNLSNTNIYSEPQKQLPVSKVIKAIDYPQTAKDCEPLFGSYIAKYQKDHPALMNLPVSMEAEKFFLYWSEKDWKRGKAKIKSLAGCVATWVGNWLDRNERRYPKPLTPKTIEQEIASYQAYGDEFAKFMEKRQGKTELSFEDFQIVAG